MGHVHTQPSKPNDTLMDVLSMKIPLAAQEQNPEQKEKLNAEINGILKKHVETKNKK